jgi:GTP cyclohydrolase IA
MSSQPIFKESIHDMLFAKELHKENWSPIHASIRNLLVEIGEDPNRQGLINTPDRVARMYQEITAGYQADPELLINGALFDVDYQDMVLVKGIEFYSLCEHHLLPFYGRAHVAYVPDGKVIGLSKIPRIVEMFARRLQIQERMTTQIAHFLESVLNPAGVAVVIKGAHMCAMMRGVRKSEVTMTTNAMLGKFEENQTLRSEFIAYISEQRNEH